MDPQPQTDSLRPLLGWGVISLPTLFAAYRIRIAPESEAITIGTLLVIVVVGVFSGIAIGRRLSFRVLLWCGISGFAITVVAVGLFVRQALAPIPIP